MADVTVKPVLKKSYIATNLQDILNSYNTKSPIISGALVVDAAHAYWWYLEFGTATEHIPSDGSGLQSPDRYVRRKDGKTRTYQIGPGGRVGTYPISADGEGIDRLGRRYTKKLRFLLYGKIVYRGFVMHAGAPPVNRGRGIVRLAARQAQIVIERKIRGYNRRTVKPLPTRQDLVDMLNQVLADMLEDVRRLTPDGARWSDQPKESAPLREAWSIRKAR